MREEASDASSELDFSLILVGMPGRLLGKYPVSQGPLESGGIVSACAYSKDGIHI